MGAFPALCLSLPLGLLFRIQLLFPTPPLHRARPPLPSDAGEETGLSSGWMWVTGKFWGALDGCGYIPCPSRPIVFVVRRSLARNLPDLIHEASPQP